MTTHSPEWHYQQAEECIDDAIKTTDREHEEALLKYAGIHATLALYRPPVTVSNSFEDEDDRP